MPTRVEQRWRDDEMRWCSLFYVDIVKYHMYVENAVIVTMNGE
jgi:hypothetical protein